MQSLENCQETSMRIECGKWLITRLWSYTCKVLFLNLQIPENTHQVTETRRILLLVDFHLLTGNVVLYIECQMDLKFSTLLKQFQSYKIQLCHYDYDKENVTTGLIWTYIDFLCILNTWTGSEDMLTTRKYILQKILQLVFNFPLISWNVQYSNICIIVGMPPHEPLTDLSLRL